MFITGFADALYGADLDGFNPKILPRFANGSVAGVAYAEPPVGH
jgi:hypothetical protein